jgi:Icc-related predicted phosphoesterase
LAVNISTEKCEIKSLVTSVENTKDSSYDLIITAGTKQDDGCEITCSLKLGEKDSQTLVMSLSYVFSKRKYTVFRFQNLTFYEKYTYICQDLSLNEKSFEFIFPKKKDEVKFVSFGDWSDCEDGQDSLKYLKNNLHKYDTAVILGDLAYNLFTDNGKVGNNFMEFMTPFTRSIPFMATSGNHETKYNYTDYIQRFNLPLKEENKNLYYSYDINDVHFVALPSDYAIEGNETNESEILKMITWLKNDLQVSQNKKWKIVYMHRPLYCSDFSKETCNRESEQMRKLFEDIFYEFKIDLVLAGHVHNYERLLPIYKGKADNESSSSPNTYINPKYPVYMICGAVGNSNGQHKKCIF